MLFASLVTSITERLCQKLLGIADNATFLPSLAYAQITVFVENFPLALQLRFADKLLITQETRSYDDCIMSLEEQSCVIRTDLHSLLQLRDVSQLPRLMNQGLLNIEGDIRIAQAFSQWITALNVDIEEWLSRQLGDVPSHLLVSFSKRVGRGAGHALHQWQAQTLNFAIEEQPLLISKVMLSNMQRDIRQLVKDTELLEKRLSRYVE